MAPYLLAAGALLLLGIALGLTRTRRYKLRQAARATLRHFPSLNTSRAATRLLASRDGLAVLLLLLNTAAKNVPSLYRYKVVLLRAVVDGTAQTDWWLDEHTHRDATTYMDTMIVFIETTVGPVLDIQRVQLSAHISKADASRFFPNAPAAEGRRWAGIPLQPRAVEIATAFIERADAGHATPQPAQE